VTARLLRGINGGVDVEVACDFGAGWVDLTIGDYVGTDEIRIIRGRRDEASQAEPSRLTLTVNNTDGRFTPRNPDSPYWPGVRFRTPIRVRVRHPHTSGSWFTRFTGFVDEWPIEWPSQRTDTIAWSPLSASGLLRRLGKGADVDPPMRVRMVAVDPLDWIPLDDPKGVHSLMPGKATSPATLFGGHVEPGAIEGPVGAQASVVSMGDSTPSLPTTVTQRASGDVRTMEAWVTGRAFTLTLHRFAEVLGAEFPQFWLISQSDIPGSFTASVVTTGGTTLLVGPTAATPPATNGFWHVAVTIAESGGTGTMILYVNGVEVGTDSDTYAVRTARLVEVATTDTSDIQLGVAYVAWYSTVLSAATIGANYVVGLGWSGEKAADRFIRIAAQEGVTVTATAGTGVAMGPQIRGNVAEQLSDCADADQGFMFENLSGGLTFQEHTARDNPATYMTLAIPGQVDGLAPVVDDQKMLNTVTANRSGGQPFTYADADSVDAFGEYDAAVSVNVETDSLLEHAASWLVNTSSDPETPRYPSLSFRFANSTDSAALVAWLAGEPLGQMLSLTSVPNPAANSTEWVFVEGYTELWSFARCNVTANCSPAEMRRRIYVLENADYLSVLGFDGQTVNTGINASATSLSVATIAGKPLITTAAGDYPRKWRNVDTGEVINVTAVSGASSPQTATITRGQDGTTAVAMSVGDVIELAVKPVLAL